MSEALKSVIDYKRGLLEDLLSQCTPKQQLFFERIWRDFDEVPEDRLDDAIMLCERTIKNNKESK